MSWVGEKGPELFVPSVAGTIIPHGSGGGGVNVAQGAVMVQVDVHGGLDHITSADLQNEIANTVNDAFDQLVTTWNGR